MSSNQNNLNKISALKIFESFKNLINYPTFLTLICSQTTPENSNKRFALLIRQEENSVNYNKSFIDLDTIEKSFNNSNKFSIELNEKNKFLTIDKITFDYAKRKYSDSKAIIVFYNIHDSEDVTQGTTLIKYSVQQSFTRLANMIYVN
jgi:hypothetical protein